MNGSFWLIIFLIFFVILPQRKKKNAAAKMIISKRKGVNSEMKELARRFIDKECIIYTIGDYSQVQGTIREVVDNAVIVESADSTEAVNLDLVTRIREYPKKKNGKKKSIVF